MPQNVVEASKQYADLAQTLLIGAGELEKELEDNLGDRGKLLGFVSSGDKAQLINAAEILTAAPEKAREVVLQKFDYNVLVKKLADWLKKFV